MSTTEILEKIRLIPEKYQQEVVDFILEKKVKKTVISSKKRPLGLLEGKMKMSDSFDDPFEDFKSYM
ncbi:type II toxin-antitoxin system VapB family antitoxin [Pedobacter glucosidilyticus]|uniref:type II toxin-antitoxin system VapB family antitoxin n=1 Tax=Pedobacter glucosidilyticus TaxID=1122941 RepID=UPI0003FBF807|nr:DUF2281 domain-containing protein [Pedobacter glucosidilyticus]